MKTFRRKIGTFELEASPLKALDQFRYLKMIKGWENITQDTPLEVLIDGFREEDFRWLIEKSGVKITNHKYSDESPEVIVNFDAEEVEMDFQEVLDVFQWLVEINAPKKKK